MKRHLCVSCLHDHRADPKNTIVQVCTVARSSCILTKVVWKCHKIIPPIWIMYVWKCYRIQILDWEPGFCESADFICQNEEKSKNEHKTILQKRKRQGKYQNVKVDLSERQSSRPKISECHDFTTGKTVKITTLINAIHQYIIVFFQSLSIIVSMVHPRTLREPPPVTPIAIIKRFFYHLILKI